MTKPRATRPRSAPPAPPGRSASSPSRRERAKDDKRTRLREAAEALFRERGFEGTTIRDVALRADLGVGTVYTYVRDKHALLEQISEHDLESVEHEAFATLPVGAGLEAEFEHVFGRVYAHHAKDPELARVIVKELSFARDATSAERQARFLRFFGRLAERVQAAQSRGEIDASLGPAEVAAHVFGLHFYVLVLWLQGALAEPISPFRASLGLAFRGIRGANAGSPPSPPVAPKKRKP